MPTRGDASNRRSFAAVPWRGDVPLQQEAGGRAVQLALTGGRRGALERGAARDPARSCMVMPLVLKGTWHQVDLLDHTHPELPEGLQRPLAVREQVSPRGFAHGPDRSVSEAAAKPFLRNLQACRDARHR